MLRGVQHSFRRRPVLPLLHRQRRLRPLHRLRRQRHPRPRDPRQLRPRHAAHRALQHARSGASSLRAVVAAASTSGEDSRVSGGHAGAVSNGGAFAATGAQAVVPAAVHFAVATAATAAADLSWSAWCGSGDRYSGCCGGCDDLADLTILDVYCSLQPKIMVTFELMEHILVL